MDRSVLSVFTRARPIFPELTRLCPNLLEHSIFRISLIHIRFRLFDWFIRNIHLYYIISNVSSEIFFSFCVYPLSCSKHVLFKAIKVHVRIYIYISTNIHIRLLIRRQDTGDKDWINIRRDNRKRETVNCVNWHIHIDSTQLFAIVIDLYY